MTVHQHLSGQTGGVSQQPFNALQFARDLANVRAHLEHASSPDHPIEHQDPSAAGFLTVINELTAGTDPTTAVARAIESYKIVDQRKREHGEAEEVRRRREEAELDAEEEVTRKVECPTCGAVAGMKCRGIGASGGLKKKSHRDRFRLARQLTDTRGTSHDQ